MTIAVSFTIVSMICMSFLGLGIYQRFVSRMEDMAIEADAQLLSQTAINLESYLRNMRRVSDAMYYSVIKDKDISTDSLDREMNLLYEANKDNLISLACFNVDGSLIGAAPVATQKRERNVAGQDWFYSALRQMENLHFSTPHVQNLFENGSYRYYWVISLSRAVELNRSGTNSLGVLLVDMNYSSIEQLLGKVNDKNSTEYVYLMDREGNLIYHPKQSLIYAGMYEESNEDTALLEDGSHEEIFQGNHRLLTVKTISYTGWKLVSVVPMSSFNMGLYGTRMFVILTMSVTALALVLINQLVSESVSKPLRELNASVKELENGNLDAPIYIGGTLETEHLGNTLQSVVNQLKELMDDIVLEQEEKRKSELDALQSQINPHFLYNTLDSIVWMIEGEKYREAVFMITQLASLFRVSLSKGKTIISIEDELRHAENYMNIQKVRYKNKFTVSFDVEDGIRNCCTVKLILQPLLENAIYYGTAEMDEDGEIVIRGYENEDGIYLEVADNGIGMPEEMVKTLLIEKERQRTKGSGVGLLNVHNRILLRFGEAYGLKIESMPDEGTIIRIHLPKIPYTLETAEVLERGGHISE